MGLSQRLELRQSHALIMTPQLMQAIKLLELSNMDFTAYVEGELERNPLLEQVAEQETAGPMPATADANASWPEKGARGGEAALPNSVGEGDDLPPADTSAQASRSNYEEDPRYSEWALQSIGRKTTISRLSSPPELSLADHLLTQLHLCTGPDGTALIGHDLIDLVDEAGYIGEPTRSGRRAPRCVVERVEAVLTLSSVVRSNRRRRAKPHRMPTTPAPRVQSFDPAMAALVGHLELLVRRDLVDASQGLRRERGGPRRDDHRIRQLNPKPGLALR